MNILYVYNNQLNYLYQPNKTTPKSSCTYRGIVYVFFWPRNLHDQNQIVDHVLNAF